MPCLRPKVKSSKGKLIYLKSNIKNKENLLLSFQQTIETWEQGYYTIFSPLPLGRKQVHRKQIYATDVILMAFCNAIGYTPRMIIHFKHKGLKLFFETGSIRKIRPDHEKRLRLILVRLEASHYPQDMNLPGLKLHHLDGDLGGH